MKIVYVLGAYGARYIANEIHRELVHEYARRGHHVVVYAGVTPGELGDEPVSYRDGPVEVRRQLIDTRGRHKIAAEAGRRIFRYPRFVPLLAGLRRVLAEHPDAGVLHADAVYPIGAITALAAIGRRAALVPSIHGGDIIEYPGYGYGRYALPRRLTRRTFGRSALVRVNSPLMAERAVELGCERAKLRQVLVNIGDRFFQYPVPLAEWRARARAEIAARHKLDPAAPLLLGTGRLLRLKGFHDLVAAMQTIARELPDARLILAGPNDVDPHDGDQRASLARAIAAAGLGERVLLRDGLHYETEMQLYLAAADLLLAPAHIEGLNRVTAEAGAQGTPSLVSETTGIAPLVRRWASGVVVPPRDPSAIACEVLRLLGDAATREQLGLGAGRLAQHFRSTTVADQLLALYQEACHTNII